MADFKAANKRTGKWEGIYSNNPDDRGGETVFGIARNMHPDWPGWVLVDMLRQKHGFPDTLKSNTVLMGLKDKFYKSQFWDPLYGDLIPSQEVAEELYDDAVNTGLSSAIRKAQSIFGMSETGVMSLALRLRLQSLK